MDFLLKVFPFSTWLMLVSVYLLAWLLLGVISKDMKIKKISLNSFVYHLLIIGGFFMILPFYWMIATSFKDYTEATAFPPTFLPREQKSFYKDNNNETEVIVLKEKKSSPGKVAVILASDFPKAEFDKLPSYKKLSARSVDWIEQVGLKDKIKIYNSEEVYQRKVISLKLDNFRDAWMAPKSVEYGNPPRPLTFGRYFYVSIFTGLLSTVGTLLTAALAAYAFAKMNFIGKGSFFYIILATMMVPGQVLLIPDYVILQNLGWLDRMHSLIIPWLASVFCIFLMRQFFMTIPNDLWDAAQIDGSGRFMYLWRVMIPLSKPVMITSGIFSFLGNWNSLLWPLIVTSKPEMRTLMVGLQMFNQEAGSDFHLLMAASTVAIMPIVVMFFFLQRFFIEGIARSGLKS